MKVSDLLKTIIDPIGIKNNDLEAALQASALKDIEIPDEVKDKFDRHYFTKERAMNDEEIVKQLRYEARGFTFGLVDEKIKKLLPLLNEEDAAEIKATQMTIDKFEKLEKAINKIKSSGNTEDVKKASQKAREIEEQLRGELDKLQNELKSKDENFTKELKSKELGFALREKIKSIKLAPEFDTDSYKKEFLANSTIDKLTKTYHLEFDESNRSDIKLLKNIDGHLKEVYEGNTKITLNDVIAKELEPFTQKSPANEKPSGNSNQQKTFEAPSDKPMTLRDMQKAGAIQ
jgi:hypothetical protein